MGKRQTMLRYIALSNAVSYLSLAAGLLAVHFAAEGLAHLTAAMWAFSALLDNFDGAFASLFPRDSMQKEFGVELDTLIDCIAFGIVPVACLRLLAFPTGTGLRLASAAASLVFVLATVTRLGNFNMLSRRGRKDFEGLPTTEATLLLATVLLFPFPWEYAWAILVVLAILMVLPIRLPHPGVAGRILLTVWLVAVTAAHLWMHLAPLW